MSGEFTGDLKGKQCLFSLSLPNRVESMESLPILSRNPSRNTERDWENASTASSIASVAEYTGNHFHFSVSICCD